MMKKLCIVIMSIISVVLLLYGLRNVLIKPEKPKIYMIVKVNKVEDNDFWRSCKIGAETAVKELNCDLVYTGPEDENDIQGQIDIIKKAIKDKPDAIVLAASDYYNLEDIAKEVKRNKIKLLTMDSDLNKDLRLSYVGTDNVAAGKEIGEKMASLLNGQGEVAIINFINNSPTAVEREKGIREQMSNYKGINIMPTEFCFADAEKSYELTKKLLQSNSNIKGIIGTNQPALEGIAKAVDELGKVHSVTVVGFDSSHYITQSIENDVISAILVQRPFNMGYLSIKSAVDAIKGKKLPKNINTSYKLITKETIFSPENEKLTFPFVE